MEEKVELFSYPQGWEEAKKRLTFLETEEEREAFLSMLSGNLYQM